MKTLAAAVVLACVPPGAAVFGFDYGGSLDEVFLAHTSGPVGLINVIKTSAWTTAGDPSSLQFNGKVSFTNQLYGATESAPEPVEFPYMFDIDRLSLRVAYDGGSVLFGRYPFSEPTGAILNHKVDGVSIRHTWPWLSARFDFGYTGFIWTSASSIQPSLADSYYAAAGDGVFGSPRMVGLFLLTPPELFGQQIRLGALVQEDLRSDELLIEEGVTTKQPGLAGVLDTQYIIARLSGNILPILTYGAFGVYGAGRSLSFIDGVYTFSPVSAWLAGGNVQLYLREYAFSLIQLRALYGSGDPDTTAFRESNVDGNLNTFISLTGASGGVAFAPNPGNTVRGELTYSVKPASASSLELLSTMQVVAKGMLFFRPTTGFISEAGIPQDSTKKYLGTEFDVMINSRPFSDLGFSVAGGIFLPSKAFVADGVEPEGPRISVRVTGSLSI